MQCVTSQEEDPVIEQLIWDVWNTEHIVTHGVTRNDVEDAIRADTVARSTYRNRIFVLGPSRGRLLAVVIGPVPGQQGAYSTFSAPSEQIRTALLPGCKGGEEQ